MGEQRLHCCLPQGRNTLTPRERLLMGKRKIFPQIFARVPAPNAGTRVDESRQYL